MTSYDVTVLYFGQSGGLMSFIVLCVNPNISTWIRVISGRPCLVVVVVTMSCTGWCGSDCFSSSSDFTHRVPQRSRSIYVDCRARLSVRLRVGVRACSPDWSIDRAYRNRAGYILLQYVYFMGTYLLTLYTAWDGISNYGRPPPSCTYGYKYIQILCISSIRYPIMLNYYCCSWYVCVSSQ